MDDRFECPYCHDGYCTTGGHCENCGSPIHELEQRFQNEDEVSMEDRAMHTFTVDYSIRRKHAKRKN